MIQADSMAWIASGYCKERTARRRIPTVTISLVKSSYLMLLYAINRKMIRAREAIFRKSLRSAIHYFVFTIECCDVNSVEMENCCKEIIGRSIDI